MSRWKLIYDEYNPDRQDLHEALCVLGNGYIATRGAFEETSATDDAHYPGTYLAGGYNRRITKVADRDVENEDLVNFPNWLPLSFRPADGEWFHIDKVDLLEFREELDTRRGVLERRLRIRDQQGKITSLVCRRIVHMARQHLAAIEWVLTPENWSGSVEFRSALDGTVLNHGVKRYRQLESKHLEPVKTETLGPSGILLQVRTNDSHIHMAQAACNRIYAGDDEVAGQRTVNQRDGYIEEIIRCDVEQGQSLHFEKVVAIYTSRDSGIYEPGEDAREALKSAGRFHNLLTSHAAAWDQLWRRCDIELNNGAYEQLVLRLHIFHLLQTYSFNTIDLDVGVPARGLHGEAYRGHIFWDELFIFPFVNLRLPELTRAMLMYRYRRLPAARRAAKEEGYQGAMFPWQSGSNGREETQVVHLNPKSGRWVPDNTHRQRHVNAAIIYNVWQYYEATNDREFLDYYGAQMIFEICQFWSSLAQYNPKRERYEIRGVVGPDEFHTQYPDSEELGLHNNAYTNVMVAWCFGKAVALLDELDSDRCQELLHALSIDQEELRRWDEMSRRMYVPFHDGEIVSQFEGYDRLESFDWEGARQKHGDIQRLDRILEAEGDSPNRYQASKQADVLMLFYLFPRRTLELLFNRLGYEMNSEILHKNIEYYLNRTSHGSTLSRVVSSWVLARSDREHSWNLFREALQSDISDIQGGTTAEGIHLGAMAGTVDLVQRCHTGLEISDDILWFHPIMPTAIEGMNLRLRYRGHWLRLEFNQQRLRVTCEHGWSGVVKIGFRDEVFVFAPGDHREFAV